MTAVCVSCGKSFDEFRYQVVTAGIHGSFDSIDCAEKERRRQLARQRLISMLGEEQAALLLAGDARGEAVPGVSPPPRPPERGEDGESQRGYGRNGISSVVVAPSGEVATTLIR